MAVRNAVASFLYSLGDVLSDPVLPRQEVKRSVKDRRNSYFVRFIQLLAKHYREQRRLGFYAEQLNLTPKYLTTLVREVSGRSAGGVDRPFRDQRRLVSAEKQRPEHSADRL